MNLFLRFFAGAAAAILGAGIAFIADLTIGDGVQIFPISQLLIPVDIGGSVGYFLGFAFYKFTGKLFGYLSRFGIETSP